jgi:cell division protein FtsN
MKKQVSPAMIMVVLALVVVGVGFFLWHAATDKPAYPGMNAMRPADETATRSEQAPPPGQPITYEQAKKMRIPGMNPHPPGAPPSNPPGQ